MQQTEKTAGTDPGALLEALFRSRQCGKDLLDSVSDGVLFFDKDRKVLFINEQARHLLGYQEGEIIEERCREVVKGSRCAACPLKKLLETGSEEKHVQMNYTTRDGRFLEVRTSFVILRDHEGRDIGYAEIFKDVSEISELRRELKGAGSFDSMVGRNSRLQEIYQLIAEVAPTDATVLITGESGTGKELIARAVHNYSRRKAFNFVKVNCAALAEGVLESELFGHVKGAFTGAYVERKGRFELAHKGTIFLDEIGDLGPAVQVKLLRVLQEGEFEMVGHSEPRHTDVRVVAATNRDLPTLLKEGRFREDLYYRLKVVPISVPRLRDRPDDIPLLVEHFVKRNNIRMKRDIKKVAPEVMNLFVAHPFPGNIRELENVVEHAFVRCQTDTIEIRHLPSDFFLTEKPAVFEAASGIDPLARAERDALAEVLQRCGWNIQTALKVLKISRATLWRKMKEYDIRKP